MVYKALKEGEIWYVSLGDDITVRPVKIVELTRNTVLLEFKDGPTLCLPAGPHKTEPLQRYNRDRIEFVEKIDG